MGNPKSTETFARNRVMREETFTGELRAMGWVNGPVVHVRVRLADVSRTVEWREVIAESLTEAVKAAESQDDVEVVLEASWVAGGVVT